MKYFHLSQQFLLENLIINFNLRKLLLILVNLCIFLFDNKKLSGHDLSNESLTNNHNGMFVVQSSALMLGVAQGDHHESWKSQNDSLKSQST